MEDTLLRTRFDWQNVQSTEEWLSNYLSGLSEKDADTLSFILNLIETHYTDDIKTPAGEPVHKHVLRVAEIVAQMDLLPESVFATLLAALPLYLPHWKEVIQDRVPASVIHLIDGLDEIQKLTEFVKVDVLDKPEDRQKQAETMRKMLLAMVSDIRVVLIKLAMRTRTMQYLGRCPDSENKRKIAKETLDIFAPLANRLGVWQLKWQLEDLGLRYQQPDIYQDIVRALDEKRTERIEYIESFVSGLSKEIEAYGIACDVAGRAKHIFSIYKKMQQKKLSFSGLYDIRAVRVLVNTVPECYTVLGIVHSLWQPIPGEFDDYIAHPKSNDYRSLHTVVVGPEDKGVEIQIRTHEMHEFAEFGVAAHWRYKEGGKGDNTYEEKIAWLRQLLDWRENMAESEKEDLAEAFKMELFQDTIYVLTPHGKVLSLPQGSTPIDFAYALHSDIGSRCRGAKVNGQIVPLSTALENGQRVEIIVAKTGNPSVDWLHEGWVKSPRAISKIRSYIRQLNGEAVRENGRNLLEKELAKSIYRPNLQKLAERLGFAKTDDFYVSVGQGDISSQNIFKAIRDLEPTEAVVETTEADIVHKSKQRKDKKGSILIDGQSGLLTVLAKCCKPAPPDDIMGFVTRERGISIHRVNCDSFHHLKESHPEKVVSASWSTEANQDVFAIDIQILADDRSGLLRDASDVFSRNKINVVGIKTHLKDHVATMVFTVELREVEDLPRVLTQLGTLKNVMMVSRV